MGSPVAAPRLSQVLLSGQEHVHLGAVAWEGLDGVHVGLSAGQSPAAEAAAQKLYANEEAVALLGDGQRVLVALCDGHQGSAGHVLAREILSRAQGELPNSLSQLSRLLLEPFAGCEPGSGTTLLLVCIELASGRVFGLSFGDSSALVLTSRGCTVLNRHSDNYLHPHQPTRFELASTFSYLLGPGEGLLLYSDGLNECCYGQPSRSLQLRHLWECFWNADQQAQGWASAVAAQALAGVDGHPGGQDNLSLVAWVRPGGPLQPLSEPEFSATPRQFAGWASFASPPGPRRISLGRLLLYLMALGCSCLVGALGSRQLQRTAGQRARVAELNGVTLRRQQLDTVLSLFRQQALDQLCFQTAVEQEAQRFGLQLDPAELPPLPEGADPLLQEAQRGLQRTEKLLQKLILKDVREGEWKQLHRIFAPELAEYSLSCLFFLNAEDVRTFQNELDDKVDFKALVQKYSRDTESKLRDGRLGYLNYEELVRKFGREAADRMVALPESSQAVHLMETFAGTVAVRMDDRRDSFLELKPALERLVVESERPLWFYNLAGKSSVASPILTQQQRWLTQGTPSPGRMQSAAPTPSLIRADAHQHDGPDPAYPDRSDPAP